MTCIKTGAVVYFPDYGKTLAADLYEVAGAIIIRTARQALEKGCYDVSHVRSATHEVLVCVPRGVFCRDDIGIFVVPKELVKEL